MPDLLERADEDTRTIDTEGGDHDRFAHYYRKTDIERAFFEGATIQAACGKWDCPTRDFQKYPVCPECKELFDAAPDENPEA
ncbi:DUF3039 domain-containing protein [Leifsonia aquatica]|uniref:DUF3039 domain-containing protein n=1 Tax=Leifsonia aquatica TaxID=144185 RepID=UPI00046ADC1D|nr:DUF3039 domain-containing protein [Leifsonia aquatica]